MEVLLRQDHSYREIVSIDLAQFERPSIPGNRSFMWKATWYVANGLFFKSSFLALAPSSTKAWLLRCFGAEVGTGLVCKPRVSIKYPWFLSVGDNVWIGEDAWIDNVCAVTIGSNVCISQGVRIITGNHDWSDPKFGFFARPVTIGDGSWITAFRVLGPGTEIPAHVAVL